MDFIRGNRGIVDADELKFTLRNPVTHEKFSHPFTLQPSLDVGKFGAGCIYAVARATLGVEIQPYQTATCTVQLSGPSDLSDDDVPKLAQVLRARCVLESDGLVTWPKDGGRPRPRSTDSDLRSIEMEKSSNEGTIARSNSDHHETVAPRCGAASASDPVTTPFSLQTRERSYHVGPTDDVDQSLRVLPFGVVVPSDLLSERQCDFPLAVVPFAPGLIELEIQNNSGSHIILRKGSVVACVHPASLDELMFWYENAPKEVMVQSASLELIPFTDKAEIQLEPRLPPISKDQPLPDDLQAMVDRCDLTSDQKASVADVSMLKFLGFVLTSEGIGADEEKVSRIVHWPKPINVKELRSWLGLAQFYARFISHMADIVAPLYDLTRDRAAFLWTDKCQQAFDQIKTALTSALVLGVARADKGVFVVHCDASQVAVACILSQDQDGSLNIFKEDDGDLDLDSCSLASDLEELSLETRMEVDNEFGLSFGDFGPPSAISTVAAAASAAPASAVPAPVPAPTAPVTASASAPPRAPVRRVSRIPRRRPQPPAQPPARAPAQPQAQAQPQARPRAQAQPQTQPQPQAQPRAQPPTQPQAQPRAQSPTQPQAQPRQPSRGHTQARQRASLPAGQRKRPAQPPRRSAGPAARAPKRSAPGHVSRNQPKRKRQTPQKGLSELRGHVQKLQQEIATLRQVSVPAQGPPMQMAMPSMPSPYAMPFPMFMPPMYPLWRQ
ncbi:Retrovirus-related Pol polyprotein from transposon opus [Frankliniella fusca]|uniref:RNA-directed DNA polymerase n=1 Tax=Frankliniella fusca TaxID=407009 RepID=A0AAE1LN17_9NEOP|nr:Retrovirus-related Pol polyprotein from transposon opus [Frankliniella fusca]